MVEQGIKLKFISKEFKITKQRITQIYAKANPKEYSEKTYLSAKKTHPEKLKNWTKRKLSYLNIKLGNNQALFGVKDGRNYIRELVRIRDNHTCQKCFKVWENGKRRFDVHHTDPSLEGRSGERGIIKLDKQNLDNMITYCHKCHFQEHSVKQSIINGRKKISTV